MATVTKENIGNLHDKITVKVNKEDYLPEFEKSLKSYSKRANIPGFRKGMVPVGMVKKMYGKAVFQEEVIRKVEMELQEFLKEEKTPYFSQPLPLNQEFQLDMDKPGDYEFAFEIGERPAVNASEIGQLEVTKERVVVNDAMVEEEIEKIRENAKDSEEVEELTEEVIGKNPKIGFEVSWGAEGTFDSVREYTTLSEAFQKELAGKKQNDRIELQANEAFVDEETAKAFVEDVKRDHPAAEITENSPLEFRIVTLSVPKERELNEEFFNLVLPGKDLKTLEDFKAALKEEIQKQWDEAATNKADDAIYHQLLDQLQFEFPEQYLRRYLKIGGKEEKTDEEVDQEYPGYIKNLKWNLITDTLIDEYKIEVTPEEVREATRKEVMGYFGAQMGLTEDAEWMDGFVDRLMEDKKRNNETVSKLYTQKIFEVLRSQVQVNEKEVSKDEFMKLVEEHKH